MLLDAPVGESRLEADSRSFIFNSWPIVKTDTSKFLCRAEPNTSLFPATNSVDPILGIHSHCTDSNARDLIIDWGWGLVGVEGVAVGEQIDKKDLWGEIYAVYCSTPFMPQLT